mmetsp:Transcript_16964/g.37049  ORF Transcript_16964/g.37049 Transcript_16964/m.37049 type:complete len:183 (+) Transcript_16964:1170-1718(+)
MSLRKANSAPLTDSFSLNFTFPYMMYTYLEDGRNMMTVDFLVPTIPKVYYAVQVEEGGAVLSIGCHVPAFFTSRGGRELAVEDSSNFSSNHHKATAFDVLAEQIQKKHEPKEDTLAMQIVGLKYPMKGAPMRIKLPFKVEEDSLNWDYLAFPNEDDNMEKDLDGHAQVYIVITVDLRTATRP